MLNITHYQRNANQDHNEVPEDILNDMFYREQTWIADLMSPYEASNRFAYSPGRQR